MPEPKQRRDGGLPTDDRRDERFEAFCGRASRAAGALVAFVGFLNLSLWAIDRTLPFRISFHGVPMARETAFAYLLSGISLRLANPKSDGRLARRAGDAFALLVAAIGLLTLVRYLSGWVSDRTPGWGMAPNTAVIFSLLGASIFLGRRRLFGAASSGMAIAAGFLCLLGVMGYAYNTDSLLYLGKQADRPFVRPDRRGPRRRDPSCGEGRMADPLPCPGPPGERPVPPGADRRRLRSDPVRPLAALGGRDWRDPGRHRPFPDGPVQRRRPHRHDHEGSRAAQPGRAGAGAREPAQGARRKGAGRDGGHPGPRVLEHPPPDRLHGFPLQFPEGQPGVRGRGGAPAGILPRQEPLRPVPPRGKRADLPQGRGDGGICRRVLEAVRVSGLPRPGYDVLGLEPGAGQGARRHGDRPDIFPRRRDGARPGGTAAAATGRAGDPAGKDGPSGDRWPPGSRTRSAILFRA